MENQLKTVQLSPSDFAFLYDECPRCFWNKTSSSTRIYRPYSPMSGIFNKIDEAMKTAVEGRLFSEIDPSFPACGVQKTGGYVQSAKIQFPSLGVELFIKGKYDTLTFETLTDEMRSKFAIADGVDRGFGVFDFKSSTIKPEHLIKYSRQLHAYAYALMRPAEHMPQYSPIVRLGLLVYEPYVDGFKFNEKGASLQGACQYVPVEFDKAMFGAFLKEIANLVSQDTAPAAGATCEYCSFLRANGVDMEVSAAS